MVCAAQGRAGRSDWGWGGGQLSAGRRVQLHRVSWPLHTGPYMLACGAEGLLVV